MISNLFSITKKRFSNYTNFYELTQNTYYNQLLKKEYQWSLLYKTKNLYKDYYSYNKCSFCRNVFPNYIIHINFGLCDICFNNIKKKINISDDNEYIDFLYHQHLYINKYKVFPF